MQGDLQLEALLRSQRLQQARQSVQLGYLRSVQALWGTNSYKVGFALDQAIFHPGPINVYMSKSTASSVKTYNGDGTWFKIYELGANVTSSAITFLADNQSQFTFKIPAATRQFNSLYYEWEMER